jgi:endonuclease/exonuclease/phosphatase family metal-dependent hydrolase
MFHVINTHYDDAGIVARAESSWLIRRYAHEYTQKVYKNHWEDPSAPVILLGDFSMSPPLSYMHNAAR